MSCNTFILLIPVNWKDSFFSQLDSDVYLFSSWGLPGEVRGRHTVCYAHKGHLVSFLSHLHRSRRVNHWLSWTGNENVMGKQSEQCYITLNTYSYTSVLHSRRKQLLLPSCSQFLPLTKTILCTLWHWPLLLYFVYWYSGSSSVCST